MTRHHAPDELLLDYAAGALPEGPALAVALHVALDPGSRRLVHRLLGVGGALFHEDSGAADMGEAALEEALARLDDLPGDAGPVAPRARAGFEWAPAALRPYLAGKTWRRAFGGFEEIRLDLHGDPHRVVLLKLEPGQGLPPHRHVANEYAVVLQGGYTDNTGNYVVGDFAVGPGAQEHRPVADPGDPCIALIVLEKPIVLTGFRGRLFNGLLRRGWM
ncbi:MAG: cupin domain-containing protein [Proteobacteria bacterium]|nr:cupin domain-containing protein [Pseudomonadota bacterium]